MNKEFHALSLILTATVSMAVGAGLMYYKSKDQLSFMEKYPQYLEAQELMKDSEVGLPEVTDDVTVYNSYLSLYNDRYTSVDAKMTTQEYNVSHANTSPASFGTGFKVAYDPKVGYSFSEITEGMAASEAGLKAGDIILAVNGEDEGANEKFIRGLAAKEGTTVDLVIQRSGKYFSVKLPITCDVLASSGVTEKMYGDILYLKLESISIFSASGIEDVLNNNSPSSLVLDLRQNGGGDVDQAVKIADYFIDEAEVVLTNKMGNSTTYKSTDGKAYDLPMVVLIDAKTASSGEILTSLLKQYADATLVGKNTFGKGIYQNNGTINGATLRYTAGTFTVGDWPCWQGVGIAPDIEVKMDPDLIGTDEDIQLQKALEILG
ncbi:MAG: PDZ domain-containing protein [Butyrivibrio sp.]|nr:PDZ domain-containing protein [Ruminococcus sp.]MBP3279149.1 PDZ domain-containing protein [Butyrivibrio sp.]